MSEQAASSQVDADQVRALVEYLRRSALGRENARTAREIAPALCLGRHGDRLLRALANAAAEAGHLVCTGNAGYWLATGPADLHETAGRLRTQALEMLRRADRMRALAEQIEQLDTQLSVVDSLEELRPNRLAPTK